MRAVSSVTAVYGADEAGASAVAHVAFHHRAPGAPQRAVPVAVAGRRRALEASVPQGEGREPRLTAGEIVFRLGRLQWPRSKACGQGGSLFRQDADGEEGAVYKLTVLERKDI